MGLLYTVDVPMRRWPVANAGLIGFTCLVSGAALLFPRAVPERWGGWPILLSLFVHGNVLHFISNMTFLFAFGSAVNGKIGHVPFLASYLGLGLAANLLGASLGDDRVPLGASGAISGVVGVFLVLFPRNDVCQSPDYSIPAYRLIGFQLLTDILGTALCWGRPGDFFCHVVACLGGIVVALTVLTFGGWPPTAYEENLLQLLGRRESTNRFDWKGQRIARPRAAPARGGRPPRR